MKLYYAPGACSLSTHIALREAGYDIDLVKVDLASKKTEAGDDFYAVAAKGQVPALKLDTGEVLTEGAAIVQYVADQKPEKKLAPAAGSMARYRLVEWLNYVASEMHKAVGALFNKKYSDDTKQIMKDALKPKFDYLSAQLKDRPFLMGEAFTVADGYLFTILSWTSHVGVDLSKWPVLTDYVARIGARPAVQATLKAEGLI
ncbi:MAG TPA: glutathione transferase GstA [Terriglobales bacterium]|nr:glutathione transferase GstA [Terriglobales bacterium]